MGAMSEIEEGNERRRRSTVYVCDLEKIIVEYVVVEKWKIRRQGRGKKGGAVRWELQGLLISGMESEGNRGM